MVENSVVCHDYQEIKVQESVQVMGVGSIPRSIPVIMMDDLVDIVKAGGIIEPEKSSHVFACIQIYSVRIFLSH